MSERIRRPETIYDNQAIPGISFPGNPERNILKRVIGMKRFWKGITRDLWIVLLDIIAVNAAYFLALMVRLYVNFQWRDVARDYYLPAFFRFAPIYTILAIIIFMLFRLYGGVWRYAGMNDMNRIICASAVTTAIQVLGTLFVITPGGQYRMPVTYYVIGALLQFMFIALIRFGYRILLVEKKKLAERNTDSVPAMIIGAGEIARKAISHLEDTPFRPVVAADEKSAGKNLNGIPVVANYEESLSSVKVVFIADRGLDAEKRREIREKCEAEGIEVQDYTGVLANLGGRVPLASLLGYVRGPVWIVLDGQETEYTSGEEALKELKEQLEIGAIEGAKVSLKRPSAAAYEGYETWARQHKEETGEDVSFF